MMTCVTVCGVRHGRIKIETCLKHLLLCNPLAVDLSDLIISMSPFLVLGVTGKCLHFYCILHKIPVIS